MAKPMLAARITRDETPAAVTAVTVLRKPCVWVAQLRLVEERQSSAFERRGSVPRGATPAMDAEAEGARGERGEQEASPSSPSSPASEARARVVSPSNHMRQLK